MSKIFNSVQMSRPKKNAFNLSHEKKLSMNMGDLVPILVQEVVPGDKFRVNTEAMVRLAPMTAPVMHRCNVFMHYFFVPNRIVWDDWETFITGGPDGKQNPAFPKFHTDDAGKALYAPGTLADYMGVPSTDISAPHTVPLDISVLPFRAYQMIYNEYFRDQNLQAKIEFSTGSTIDYTALLTMRKRCWEKDYFTSALPWAQRGDEVSLPIEPDYADITRIFNAADGSVGVDGAIHSKTDYISDASGTNPKRIENLASGGSITINELRRTIRLQEWLEKNARGGARYIEQILSHFGVTSSNKLLQRPQYLGGGKQPIVISEVLATFNNETVPGGDMYGHGISVGNSNRFKHFFEEHGFIIGIMSVLPRTGYQQGINRSLIKFDKFDYFWPEFANIGEQEIYEMELYHDYKTSSPLLGKDLFGYTPRYSEYKFNQSSVHGNFKTDLDYWHMGRIFETWPQLNGSFVESDPTKRIWGITKDEHKLYVQLYHNIQAIRPMPVFGTPTL